MSPVKFEITKEDIMYNFSVCLNGIKSKLFSLVLIIIFFLQVIFSQSLEERLSRSSASCETFSINSQKLIGSYSVHQKDSIRQVITIWKKECGNIEPIRRLSILLDIHTGTFNYEDYGDYLTNELYKFSSRIHDSKTSNRADLYERNKGYYNYIKLGGVFDAWTKTLSDDLITEIVDENTDEYLLLLLFSENIAAFYDALYEHKNRNLLLVQEYKEMINSSGLIFFNYCVYVGVWNPIGQLAEHFEKSPQFGFGVNFNLKRNYSVQFKGQLTRFLNNKELEFLIDNQSENVKPDFGMLLGISLAKEYSLFQDRAFIDLYSGINIALIDTNLKKENATSEDGTEAAETVNLEIGLNFRKTLFKQRSIGVNVALNYSPYNLDSQLKTDVGSMFGQANLFFRF